MLIQSAILLHVQNKVEKSLVYAQQQREVHAAGAVKIQAAWRGLAARRNTATIKVIQAQQRHQGAAAVRIQVSMSAMCIATCSPRNVKVYRIWDVRFLKPYLLTERVFC